MEASKIDFSKRVLIETITICNTCWNNKGDLRKFLKGTLFKYDSEQFVIIPCGTEWILERSIPLDVWEREFGHMGVLVENWKCHDSDCCDYADYCADSD